MLGLAPISALAISGLPAPQLEPEQPVAVESNGGHGIHQPRLRRSVKAPRQIAPALPLLLPQLIEEAEQGVAMDAIALEAFASATDLAKGSDGMKTQRFDDQMSETVSTLAVIDPSFARSRQRH